ncbi:MAG: hypothetical protein SFV81_08675 [Pirellulaceae bacterium]|nr:hypothetical protein [Pirellulaceae bacterium]
MSLYWIYRKPIASCFIVAIALMSHGCQSNQSEKAHNLELVYIACLEYHQVYGMPPPENGNEVYWARFMQLDTINWRGVLLQQLTPIGSHSKQTQQSLGNLITTLGSRVFDDNDYRIYANFNALADLRENAPSLILFAFLKRSDDREWYEDENVSFTERFEQSCRASPNTPIVFVTNKGIIASVNPSHLENILALFDPSSRIADRNSALSHISVIDNLTDQDIPQFKRIATESPTSETKK